ncbi:NHLP family bacteriocin export ABC transporter peptidase/permease/ATPase subunit [Candidatus Margulisiibacteriota bacterium]
MFKIFSKKTTVKTPVILQMEAVECGAAALAIILEYYGRVVPLEKLRMECGVSRDGSRADTIVQVAEKHSLSPAAFRVEIEDLKRIEPPYIVFWCSNHFLVVEGFSEDEVYLNDPASGRRTEKISDFQNCFSNIVLTFKPKKVFKKTEKRPSLFFLLNKFLKNNSQPIKFVFLTCVLLILTSIVIPTVLRVFIDKVLIHELFSWTKPLLFAVLIIFLIQYGLFFLQRKTLDRLKNKLILIHSSSFLWRLFELPIRFFLQRSRGEISSRIDINVRVSKSITDKSAISFFELAGLVLYVLIMFFYDWLLTLISLACLSVYLGLFYFVSRQKDIINQKLVREHGNLVGTTTLGLHAMETLKATGAEDEFFERWSGFQTKAVNVQHELEVSRQGLNILPSFFNSIVIAVVLCLGSYRIISGELSIGLLMAFFLLLTIFLGPIKRMMQFGFVANQTKADLSRIDDIFKYKTLNIFGSDTGQEEAIGVVKLAGNIEIQNLSFGFTQLEPPLFEGFNLSLKPGSRIALVGPSGCGKTTLSKMICGLYMPWEGEILFDGKSFKEFSPAVLSNSLALVSQEIFLFEGTVRDNITLWDTTIPETIITKAAKDALIHEDIAARTGGYESHVEENGGNFSGGQRQRIEIARALATNPSILVLDEATSSLDPDTERIIDNNIRRRGCSCLVISHRLSTIKDCDEIIVLSKGQIAERGTHKELFENPDGLYRTLVVS